MNGRPWVSEELQLLQFCQTHHMPQSASAAAIGRTRAAIKSKASELGYVREPFWTPAKKARALQMLADGYSSRLVGELMGCSAQAVRSMAMRARKS